MPLTTLAPIFVASATTTKTSVELIVILTWRTSVELGEGRPDALPLCVGDQAGEHLDELRVLHTPE